MNNIRDKIKEGLTDFHFNTSLSLESLPKKPKLQLEKASTKISLKKKQILFKRNDSPKGIYILLKGKIKVYQLNYDGSIQILFIYAHGEVFGYRPLLSLGKHPVSAAAIEDCELLFIPKEIFLKTLSDSVELSNQILKSVNHEFTVMVNRFTVFAQRGIKERLALSLLLLNEKFLLPNQITTEAEIKINRTDLANYAGTSLENLVRTIKQFEEKKYLRTIGKSIFIENFEALYILTGI
ncbi:MAG: Crp/Fnr family transcriptional regulator [Bacteroidia bacterium]